MTLPLSRRKEVFSDMHGGISGSHFQGKAENGFIWSDTTSKTGAINVWNVQQVKDRGPEN